MFCLLQAREYGRIITICAGGQGYERSAGGGLIIQCDHAVPPDISFDNYRYYRDLVRKLSE
jgi:hypothetical protein